MEAVSQAPAQFAETTKQPATVVPTSPAAEAVQEPALTAAAKPMDTVASVVATTQRTVATAEATGTDTVASVVPTVQQATEPFAEPVINAAAQVVLGLDEAVTAVAGSTGAVTENVWTEPAVGVAQTVVGTVASAQESPARVHGTSQPLVPAPQGADASQSVTVVSALGGDLLSAPAVASADTGSEPASAPVSNGSALQRGEDAASVERLSIFPALPGARAEDADSASPGWGGTSAVQPPNSPTPFVPGGLPGALGSASASAAAGVLVVFLAAVAAALLLAAPGLGRRLRLIAASWPPPIPQLSLERPG